MAPDQPLGGIGGPNPFRLGRRGALPPWCPLFKHSCMPSDRCFRAQSENPAEAAAINHWEG